MYENRTKLSNLKGICKLIEFAINWATLKRLLGIAQNTWQKWNHTKFNKINLLKSSTVQIIVEKTSADQMIRNFSCDSRNWESVFGSRYLINGFYVCIAKSLHASLNSIWTLFLNVKLKWERSQTIRNCWTLIQVQAYIFVVLKCMHQRNILK